MIKNLNGLIILGVKMHHLKILQKQIYAVIVCDFDSRKINNIKKHLNIKVTSIADEVLNNNKC